ncbi:hypothetical protein JNUCC0626_13775 [Lentzea sp. JNUCC 0626]|uniref:hypothetical protein n=1 Tax=Lentzea sp. JNUCC 0626 TaxID=3367513 RepID=UPI003748E19E
MSQKTGLISVATTTATMVHDLQVVDGDLPETSRDFSDDLIVMPTQVIEGGPPRRLAGILWLELDPAKIAAIPALDSRTARRDVGWLVSPDPVDHLLDSGLESLQGLRR